MVNEYNIWHETHITATVTSVQWASVVVQAAVDLDKVKGTFAFVLDLYGNKYNIYVTTRKIFHVLNLHQSSRRSTAHCYTNPPQLTSHNLNFPNICHHQNARANRNAAFDSLPLVDRRRPSNGWPQSRHAQRCRPT